jgi:hypothetical protein
LRRRDNLPEMLTSAAVDTDAALVAVDTDVAVAALDTVVALAAVDTGVVQPELVVVVAKPMADMAAAKYPPSRRHCGSVDSSWRRGRSVECLARCDS